MIIQPCEMESLRNEGYYEGRLSTMQSWLLGKSREEVMRGLFTLLMIQKANG